MDSLASTELVNSIQRELGSAMKLSSTMAFDYPTAKEMARCISDGLQPQPVRINAHAQAIAELKPFNRDELKAHTTEIKRRQTEVYHALTPAYMAAAAAVAPAIADSDTSAGTGTNTGAGTSIGQG